MNSFVARATFISFFLGLAAVTQGQAEDYWKERSSEKATRRMEVVTVN